MADEALPKTEQSPTTRPKASWALVVLASIAIVVALYLARDLLIPIVFSLLLALLFRPIQRRTKKWRIPNGVSAAIIVTVVAGLFTLALVGLAGQAQRWLADAPDTVRSVREMLPTSVGPMADLKEAGKEVEEITKDSEEETAVGDPTEEEPASQSQPAQAETAKPEKADAEPAALPAGTADWAMTVLGVSSYAIGATVITFVLFYFLLALSDQLTCLLVEAMPTFDDKRSVVQVLSSVEEGISNYLGTITVINIGLGIVTAVSMWFMDLPNPILWGVMTTTLNFVPHVGAFFCMLVLFVVGAVTHQSLAWGAATAGVFILFTSAESYFITPMVLSKRLQLSPLAVILAILFGGWLWGVGGGLMAAPLLAIAKIVCDQLPSLHPVAAFLGGEPASAVNKSECSAVKDATQQSSSKAA